MKPIRTKNCKKAESQEGFKGLFGRCGAGELSVGTGRRGGSWLSPGGLKHRTRSDKDCGRQA